MKSEREKSIKAVDTLQQMLGFSTGLPAGAALMASMVANQFEQSTLLIVTIVATSAWAALCNQVRTLARGRVLRTDIWSITFIVAGLTTPGRWLMLEGLLIGLALYLGLIAWVSLKPRVTLAAGDRLYLLRHPLDFLIPLTYLAPEPLSPILEPSTVLYASPEFLWIPTWRIAVIDPSSINSYILSRAASLSSCNQEWGEVVDRFRKAIRLLGLLEAVVKLEAVGLDGAALAAGARLALNNLTDSARTSLLEALSSFAPPKRRSILEAFDILPTGILQRG
jgi:hypothetical protein